MMELAEQERQQEALEMEEVQTLIKQQKEGILLCIIPWCYTWRKSEFL